MIAAVVGGVVNVVVNAIQGNIHSWGQGFSLFGVGAVGTWAGIYAGPAVAGMIIGAGNSFVNQGFGNSGSWDWNNISGSQVFMGGIMGGITGQLSSSLNEFISPYVSNLTSDIGGQAVQQALTQGITGSATGFTLETGFSLLNGENLGDALKAGGQGALMGFGIGTATGLASGLRSAYKAGEDPWTRKSLTPKTPVYDFTPDPYGDNVTLYRGTTGTESNSKFPLYMTDDPNYAGSYVSNGGRVVETTIPRSTIKLMEYNETLNISPKPQYHINGTSGIEYKFSPQVKPFIVYRFR